MAETTTTPTRFQQVYDSFLSKITDDMYLQLTYEDTLNLLEELLFSALPKFEFPRQQLSYEMIAVENQDEDQEPKYVWVLIYIILILRAIYYLLVAFKYKTLSSRHSILNKVAGFLMFCLI